MLFLQCLHQQTFTLPRDHGSSSHTTTEFPEVLTLGLHACPHKSQWVTGELSAGTGNGATSQENKDSRVSTVDSVALQPGIF